MAHVFGHKGNHIIYLYMEPIDLLLTEESCRVGDSRVQSPPQRALVFQLFMQMFLIEGFSYIIYIHLLYLMLNYIICVLYITYIYIYQF